VNDLPTTVDELSSLAEKGAIAVVGALATGRWDFRPATWSFLLRTYGFQQVTTRELPATIGFRGWPTMLVTGQTSLSSP